jgi:predicted DNA-binding transcriptional regulator AlpA
LTVSTNPKRLLSPREVANIYGLTTAHLERLRRVGGGCRFLKLGQGRTAPIRYRQCDIDEWLEGLVRTSTSDSGPGNG